MGRFNPSGGIGSIYTNASVQNVFSSTKAITSVVMAMLVDRGHISYDTPVATLWPEFAQYDKEDITLSDVLRHESGLHEFDFALNGDDLHREKLKDRNSVVRHKIAMAKKRRHHGRHHHKDHHKSSHHHSKSNDKGDQHQEHQRAEDQSSESSNNSNKSRAYHAITRGWILNEICQRVDPHKRTVGEFIRDEIARPLGISKELTLGTETLALLEGGDNSLVPLKHTPLSWLILEICNIFNRRMPLRFLMVSIALKNVRDRCINCDHYFSYSLRILKVCNICLCAIYTAQFRILDCWSPWSKISTFVYNTCHCSEQRPRPPGAPPPCRVVQSQQCESC